MPSTLTSSSKPKFFRWCRSPAPAPAEPKPRPEIRRLEDGHRVPIGWLPECMRQVEYTLVPVAEAQQGLRSHPLSYGHRAGPWAHRRGPTTTTTRAAEDRWTTTGLDDICFISSLISSYRSVVLKDVYTQALLDLTASHGSNLLLNVLWRYRRAGSVLDMGVSRGRLTVVPADSLCQPPVPEIAVTGDVIFIPSPDP
ncbi:hypothetical protein C8Q78DRAFT_987229 [Trametes maxima]|nr:hypothetical protein C8Q78DRAFT_987229 [Trametes maxima]